MPVAKSVYSVEDSRITKVMLHRNYRKGCHTLNHCAKWELQVSTADKLYKGRQSAVHFLFPEFGTTFRVAVPLFWRCRKFFITHCRIGWRNHPCQNSPILPAVSIELRSVAVIANIALAYRRVSKNTTRPIRRGRAFSCARRRDDVTRHSLERFRHASMRPTMWKY